MAVLLTAAWPNLSHASQRCSELLSVDQGIASNVVPADFSSWNNPAILKRRVDQVVEHQNNLRHAMGAPLLSITGKKAELDVIEGTATKFLPAEIENPSRDTFMVMGNLYVEGDTVVRDFFNDFYGLNYVYRFDGASLVEAIPYVVFRLNQSRRKDVTLYRTMSDEELAVWKQKQYASLGELIMPGEPHVWAFRDPQTLEKLRIIHFSRSSRFTTQDEKPSLRIQIPKESLLDWWKTTGRLWSAEIGDGVDEIVFPPELLVQLAKEGKLKIDFLR